MTDPKKLVVGKIGSVYGVRGWLKIFSDTKPKENILNYRPWQINIKGQWQICEVAESRLQEPNIIVRFADCVDREQARRYTGAEIAINREQLPHLPVHEYYWADLIGLAVITVDGVSLGHITTLIETGSNDVLVVQGDKQRLIPYLLNDVVVEVDLAQKLMRVRWEPDF
jgi:16S rRNA processing protein RimM